MNDLKFTTAGDYMSDPLVPVTLDKTSFSGVLASSNVGKGRIKGEDWSQTTYPNGSVVTRVHDYTIEVYDNRAAVEKHNVPPLIDKMA